MITYYQKQPKSLQLIKLRKQVQGRRDKDWDTYQPRAQRTSQDSVRQSASFALLWTENKITGSKNTAGIWCS